MLSAVAVAGAMVLSSSAMAQVASSAPNKTPWAKIPLKVKSPVAQSLAAPLAMTAAVPPESRLAVTVAGQQWEQEDTWPPYLDKIPGSPAKGSG